MDITKSQSNFEAWLKSKMPTTYRLAFECGDDDELTNLAKASVLDMRTAYQAGRESIEVELPPRKSADIESEKYPDMTMYEAMMREGIWNDCIFECEKILRTAGIRIKGESE